MEQVLKPVVHVGHLRDSGVIETSEGELINFNEIDKRALWDYVRLQLGKKKADMEIRSFAQASGAIKKMSVIEVLYENMKEDLKDREVQLIMLDKDVKAVASVNHLLIPPEEVVQIAQQVHPSLHTETEFPGFLVDDLKELQGLQMKFSLDPGNILTRKAIRVGWAIKVLLCTNPLMAIGVSHLNRFQPGGGYFDGMKGAADRILRVQRKIELEDRIKESLEGTRGKLNELKEIIQDAKTTKINMYQAKALGLSYPLAFNVGQNYPKMVIDRFRREDKTLWGLAQAGSYVARHAEAPDSVRNALATSAAAYLGITDIPETVSIADKWLLERKKIDLREWK